MKLHAVPLFCFPLFQELLKNIDELFPPNQTFQSWASRPLARIPKLREIFRGHNFYSPRPIFFFQWLMRCLGGGLHYWLGSSVRTVSSIAGAWLQGLDAVALLLLALPGWIKSFSTLNLAGMAPRSPLAAAGSSSSTTTGRGHGKLFD